MCGRYELHSHPDVIALQFGLAGIAALPARYNIAPQQMVPVVRAAADGSRELVSMRWGLVPFWAKDAAIGARAINARAESVATKPMYRGAFRRFRCLLPADGFYEWQAVDRGKQPVRLANADGSLLGLAGLYDRWRDPSGDVLETCTIVTTEAAGIVAPLHQRMPVVVSPADYARWLEGSTDDALHTLARASAAGLLAHPVSRRVNDVRNDDPGLIEPLREHHPIEPQRRPDLLDTPRRVDATGPHADAGPIGPQRNPDEPPAG